MYRELEAYAKEKHVPIISKEGLNFLLSSIQKYQVKSVLEIGTAIGYSSLEMSEYVEHIVTIERNEELYNMALKNIQSYKKEEIIKLVLSDAFDYSTEEMFDMIFVDAAKAQNRKFIEKFANNLKQNGIIIVDNLNFHGLIDEINIPSRNLRNLVRKIAEFKSWIKDNPDYTTTFTDLGDGMSLSIKK